VPGRYKKPPLNEVVCAVSFTPESPWDLAVPGLVYSALKDTFPERRSAATVGMTMVPAAGGQGVAPQVQLAQRVQLLNATGTALVQVGQHFLSINHLKPYPGYNEFAPLVEQAYSAYLASASPHGLDSLLLRYINKIVIPLPSIEFSDYFNYYPFVGASMPQDIAAFLVGIQNPQESGRDVLQVQLSSGVPEREGTSVALLDLTYSLATPSALSLDEVPSWVSAAHTRIKTTFEAAITDRLRTVFDSEEVS
jgi:uncharacterized protein (TIGR04255 family)